jgi:hypothetical protein
MSVGQMTVNQMSVGELPVGQMVFDQKMMNHKTAQKYKLLPSQLERQNRASNKHSKHSVISI